ncbi:MAG: nitrous oxide-stimulated promoter family protein [Chloroflexi bacterium]|nr:nitrous oxide-stimulated promoter family protein [Chloroflexota bacterium]
MPEVFSKLDAKKEKDLLVLKDFISIYCREKHRAQDKSPFQIKDDRLRGTLGAGDLLLCADCTRLLSHGIAKRLMCPYDPKPMCKKCRTHCYAPGYRDRVREVMKFSGLYLVKRGRIDLLLHYLL